MRGKCPFKPQRKGIYAPFAANNILYGWKYEKNSGKSCAGRAGMRNAGICAYHPAVRHGRYSGGKQQRGYYSDERAYCRVCRFVRISFVRKLFRKENLKEILLFSDTGSATHTSVKVVKNIVEGCARQVEGIEVRHVRIRADEKGGFVAIVSVKATAENVTPAIGKLRELLADSFARTLNLTFSSINFNVDRLNGKYVPQPKEGDQPTAPQEQTEQQQPSEEKQEDKPRKKHKDATRRHHGE